MLIKLKIFMRKIKFVNAAYYHVYNRGVEKRKIFLNQSDYQRFLDSILVFNSIEPLHRHFSTNPTAEAKPRRNDELVKIVAFCLMPNHFHLLLKQENNNGISKYLHKLLTGYTMYFNKRHDRTGVLFQGVFKSKLVNDDPYLLHLSRYIHLNPLEILGVDRANEDAVDQSLRQYPWSSYRDYVGNKCNGGIIECENDIVLAQCGGKKGYRRFVLDELPRRSLGGERDMLFELENMKKYGAEASPRRVGRGGGCQG